MSANYWREKEAEAQHSLTDQVLADLLARVQALEEQVASLSDAAEMDDEEAAQTYMDGTPIL